MLKKSDLPMAFASDGVRGQARIVGAKLSSSSSLTWALAAMLLAASCAAQAMPPVEAGRRLFAGEPPLKARIAGHTDLLPVESARCTNCHSYGGRAGSNAQEFGPVLDARFLMRPVARRGGPPSVYSATSLCKLLREGVDPAWIVLPQTMPRYEATDAQCSALWAYLTRPTP